MIKSTPNPFPTVNKLAQFCDCNWKGFEIAAKETERAESALADTLSNVSQKRLLDPDSSMVVFGSFARYEMVNGSDFDWALLIDGVVNNQHSVQLRELALAIEKKKAFEPPRETGPFGKMIFSHELVHSIGGLSDSNLNLTIRLLLLLESRSLNLSPANNSPVWRNVVSNILERYFEEEVHFSTQGRHRVPRFSLNDLTRYWRTICVDYAAKHRQQDGKNWALRNAKIRFSRKLLYAAGLAFCLSCELDLPQKTQNDLFGVRTDYGVQPFIESALRFAVTPPLEYLAAFTDAFVVDFERRKKIAAKIFGSYNEWLILLNDQDARKSLKTLDHSEASSNPHFQQVRENGSNFASGLRELFFNRDRDSDPIANLSLNYVGF